MTVKTYSVFKDYWVIGLVLLLLGTVGGSVVIHEVTPQGETGSYDVSAEGATTHGDLNMGLFWDAYRTQKVDNIDWGVREAGTTESVTIHFANYELRPVYILGVSLLNSTPANFTSLHNYDVELIEIPALRVVPFDLSIIVDQSTPNITSFHDLISLGFSDVGVPIQPIETILNLDFESDTISDWSLDGDFSISGGQMVADSMNVARTYAVYTPMTFVNDYSLSVETYIEDNSRTPFEPESQLLIRYQDPDNFYFVGIGAYAHLGAIGKMEGGTATLLVSSPDDNYDLINMDQWYDIRIDVNGWTISLYVDDQFMCSVTDSAVNGNQIGLTPWNSLVYYDNLKVVE